MYPIKRGNEVGVKTPTSDPSLTKRTLPYSQGPSFFVYLHTWAQGFHCLNVLYTHTHTSQNKTWGKWRVREEKIIK